MTHPRFQAITKALLSWAERFGARLETLSPWYWGG